MHTTAGDTIRPIGDLARLTDEELMRAVGAAHSGAFEVLYARHADAAYRVALRLLGDAAAAQDVVQESFLRLWRSGSYQTERGSVRVFLLAIVRHRAIDVLRKDAPQRAYGDGDAGLAERLADRARTDEEVEHREEGRILRAAVQTLPPAQSQAVELAFFAELTHREIAARMQAPVGTVKARIRLGLQKLAPQLEPVRAA